MKKLSNNEAELIIKSIADKNSVFKKKSQFWRNYSRLILSVIAVTNETLNPLSTNPTIPQFADKLFECVWPFCGIGA